ncbi:MULTISPECIES: cell division protein SepF [Cytobacillus]|jgi:cell division inhibitor SepF|uniref:cell division protein SepF n=1 Tax=Cytobacillus TaxID=2675230 RepID=UPI00077C6C95|nr:MULTISPECIES: cell division protein SepF [Cytobacillus]KAF0820283.1 SepF, FtsZ-interacting protein related to cell division [Bacillus sp. ZZV12-4809]MBG9544139.1 cell division protein SepF [Cytobacillus firmus]MBG9550176.1 cell division protein SepF [Cytobacillus firmus]MBG9550709.1 cell division protein SepF [Cytobacillus firmus]MBG9556508.1 cell division protein SepF [Cytobacillus firmus]
MSIKSKFKTFFFLDDEYDYKEEENIEEEREPVKQVQKQQQPVQKQNIVSLQSVQKSSKVVLVEPRVYAEAQDIADQLKNRRAVVVNLQRIEKDQAKRIVDFLSGTVYAIGGDIQKIGTDIFLCTPDNVEVSGNISQLMKEQELENTRW